MNVMQFSFQEQKVRIMVNDAGTWFCAIDCCRVLQIVNSRDAMKNLDEDEVSSVDNTDAGLQRKVNFVSEPGLYKLIMRSRKPEARAFQRWVTHEVLPQIRQTGGYSPETTAASKLLETTARKRDALIRWELRLIMDRRGVTPEEVARLAAEAASVPGTYAGFDWQRWNVGTPSQESIERAAKALLNATPGTAPELEPASTLGGATLCAQGEKPCDNSPRPLDEECP